MGRYFGKIKSRDEYRSGIMTLRIIQELAESHGVDAKDIIDDMKRSLREYAHRPLPEDRLIYWNDYGYMTMLEMMPVWVKTEEEAEEYFDEEMRMVCRPSIYDCTGDLFTISHKIFRRHGRFMVYHSMGMDI